MSDIREQVARSIRENSVPVGAGQVVVVDPEQLTDLLLNSFVIRPLYPLHGQCQALTRHEAQCLFMAQETYEGVGLCKTHATLKKAGRPITLASGEWS
jgi:hypothetical protein